MHGDSAHFTKNDGQEMAFEIVIPSPLENSLLGWGNPDPGCDPFHRFYQLPGRSKSSNESLGKSRNRMAVGGESIVSRKVEGSDDIMICDQDHAAGISGRRGFLSKTSRGGPAACKDNQTLAPLQNKRYVWRAHLMSRRYGLVCVFIESCS